MRVRHLALIACTLLLLACLAVAAAWGGAANELQDGVAYGTSVAPPERVRAARSIEDLQGPISREEPNQCEDIYGPTVVSIGGTRDVSQLAVSPGDIELLNLEPNTDYAACMSILNFGPAEVKGRIDDVDIVASRSSSGGIDLIDLSEGVGTWVVPSTREFTVPPNSRLIIPYVVRTPAQMPAGTIVGGVAARFDSQTTVAAAITQRVYVSGPGGQHRQLELSRFSTTRVLGREGNKNYRARFDVENPSDYVESFTADVTMKGLGRTVRKAQATSGTLLPTGSMRVTAEVEDLPWIGLFRPTLKVETGVGTITRKLPWVVVLPPWPFVVALLLAIFVPIFVLLRRWWQQRQEWMQYLDEYDEDDDEEYDEYGVV